MRFVPCLLLLLFNSCRLFPAAEEKPAEIVAGDWLVLYADHELQTEEQRLLYGRIQDSVILAKGLKLVSFFEDGSFQQLDSLEAKGRWAISPGKEFYAIRGGNGFADFKARMLDYKKNVMTLREDLHVEGQTIRLKWSLKKLNAPDLFDEASNAWRRRSLKPESDEEIKTRLSIMVAYYARYFRLIQKEVTYFIRTRVILPFDYYQHAMGIKPFDPASDFAQLFFNAEQAEKAHGFLKKIIRRLGDQYPDSKNYVDEYAGFMELIAKKITTMK